MLQQQNIRTRLVRDARIRETEPRVNPLDRYRASLYDAIRNMGAYGAKAEAERRMDGGDGLRF
ncbi:hypothetical protein ACH5AO_09845 [Streptomyces sp. NPDC018964]|uniref:hypothetical protein n=1 Tax=unclassified Streptomyces TaxID=2593676 RepID=UPI003789E47F